VKKSEIRKKDKQFFEELKVSRGMKCERCGRSGVSEKIYLQPSHIYSRSWMSLRWEPLNVVLKCAKCHWWWGKNPVDGVLWLMQYYGDAKFLQLVELKRSKETIDFRRKA
jgi:hypothetical protein